MCLKIMRWWRRKNKNKKTQVTKLFSLGLSDLGNVVLNRMQ